jgi:hypothetical protein
MAGVHLGGQTDMPGAGRFWLVSVEARWLLWWDATEPSSGQKFPLPLQAFAGKMQIPALTDFNAGIWCFEMGVVTSSSRLISRRCSSGFSSSSAISQPSVAGGAAQRWQRPILWGRFIPRRREKAEGEKAEGGNEHDGRASTQLWAKKPRNIVCVTFL